MGFNSAFKGLKSASNEIRKISGSRREVVENCALLAITQRIVVIPYRRFGTTYVIARNSAVLETRRSLQGKGYESLGAESFIPASICA